MSISLASYVSLLELRVSFSLAHQARRGVRKSFPGPRDVWGAPPSLKNTEKGVPDDFFLAPNTHKIHFRLGLRPDLAVELTTLPRLLIGW